MLNHVVHRKPGSLVPPQGDLYNKQVEEITQNHQEIKTTSKPVSNIRTSFSNTVLFFFFILHTFGIQETIRLKTYSDKYVADTKWLSTIESQPSAVAIDSNGNVVIFHRANRCGYSCRY